jgi:hypothetical protein
MKSSENLLSIGDASSFLGVSIATLRRWDVSGILPAFKPSGKGHRYYKREALEMFLQQKSAPNAFVLGEQWASMPSPPAIPDEYWCARRDVFQARLHRFQNLMKHSQQARHASLLTAILGEIGNNSFDHNIGNWEDEPGVYFVYEEDPLRLYLADRGSGLLATLKRVKPELSSHLEACKTAFTEVISGRMPESRGNGLKFVRHSVLMLPFSFLFQSGNAVFTIGAGKEHWKETKASIRGCMASIYIT